MNLFICFSKQNNLKQNHEFRDFPEKFSHKPPKINFLVSNKEFFKKNGHFHTKFQIIGDCFYENLKNISRK